MFKLVSSQIYKGFRKTFSSLRHRNYRLWFIGQIISLMGTWVQMTAQGFLIYELTGSMAYLGYVGLASGLPAIVFMLQGGVLADRVPRKTLLIITQTSMMLLAFTLSSLVYFDIVLPWHIMLLATLLGIVNAFDVPARQAFVFELVSADDLTNAIALNSMMFNMAAIIGPTIAGVVYAGMGASSCFFINGLSFIGIIVILYILKFPKLTLQKKSKSLIHEIKEGITYCYKHETIRLLIIILFLSSSIGMSFITLLPAWAASILKGDAATYGYLQSAKGIGSLAGTIAIASLGNISKRHLLLYFGLLIFPIFLFFFAANHQLMPALISLSGVGLGIMIVFNSLNSLIQTATDDHLRGRVMSVYSLAFFGGMPLGSFLSGSLAEHFGAQLVLEISAFISLIVAITFMIKSKALRTTFSPKKAAPLP